MLVCIFCAFGTPGAFVRPTPVSERLIQVKQDGAKQVSFFSVFINKNFYIIYKSIFYKLKIEIDQKKKNFYYRNIGILIYRNRIARWASFQVRASRRSTCIQFPNGRE